MSFLDLVQEARKSGDLASLVAHVPYMAAMGMEMHIRDGGIVGVMPFADHLVGNYNIQALHGGTLGALLESTAALKLIWEHPSETMPRIVNITVEYLRSAKAVDTYARAEITKQGRRAAAVRIVAWQGDPNKLVAAANARFLVGE